MNDKSKHRRHISAKHFCLSKTEAEAFGCKSPKTKSPGLHTDLRPVRPFRNQTRRFSVKYKREGHFSFFVLRFIRCSSSKLRLQTRDQHEKIWRFTWDVVYIMVWVCAHSCPTTPNTHATTQGMSSYLDQTQRLSSHSVPAHQGQPQITCCCSETSPTFTSQPTFTFVK